MGWSYSNNAGKVLDSWIAACIKQTNSENKFIAKNGETYIWEERRTSHDDGSITGVVHKVTAPVNDQGLFYSKSAGSFKINGNGTIERAPKWLKDAAKANL